MSPTDNNNGVIPSIGKKQYGDITLDVLPQPAFRRTLVLLQMAVPADYKVLLVSKQSGGILSSEKKQKAGMKKLTDAIVKLRKQGQSNSVVQAECNKIVDDFKKNNPGPEPVLSTVFTFHILQKPGNPAQIQDFCYQLHGINHHVTIKVEPEKNLSVDDAKLDNLVKVIAIA